MRRLFFLVTLIIVFSFGSFALSPDIQADQYLIAAKSCIDEGEYREAANFFEKILALNVPVPDQFHYHYACTLKEIRNNQEARNQILEYLELAGRGGEYYIDALGLLNDVEELLQYRRLLVRKEYYDIDQNYSGTLRRYCEYSYNSQGFISEEKLYERDDTFISQTYFGPPEPPAIHVRAWVNCWGIHSYGYFDWERVPIPVPQEETSSERFPGYKEIAGVWVPSAAQCRTDESGRLVRVTIPSWSSRLPGETFTFTYNTEGKVNEATVSRTGYSRTARYTYDERGRVQEVNATWFNERDYNGGTLYREIISLEYDEDGRPVKVESYHPERSKGNLEVPRSLRTIFRYDDVRVSGE